MNNRKIEMTADGSATIYVSNIDEHYHSIKGALTESLHIFRDCAFRYHPSQNVRVLEVGLGTGLNAAVTASDTTKQHTIYYAIELYPLDESEIAALAGYDSYRPLLHDIHAAPWGQDFTITPHFTLHKIPGDFTDATLQLPQGIDVCYMDAFSPEKQPEMWSREMMCRLFQCMAHGGILTTYCAKGEVRRRLASAGFTIERLAGPPCGKREILRATKV